MKNGNITSVAVLIVAFSYYLALMNSYLITVITVGMETQSLLASYCTAHSPLKCLSRTVILHMADVFVLLDQIN